MAGRRERRIFGAALCASLVFHGQQLEHSELESDLCGWRLSAIQNRMPEDCDAMTESNNGRTNRDERNARGQFILGHTGNLGGGRPKGSRNRLGEAFLSDLASEWERSGAEALARCAKDHPAVFCKVVAGLLPKEIDAQLTVEHVELFSQARNFAEAFRLAQRYIGGELEDEPEALIEVEADGD
jgi:hypothetical protein